MKKLIVANWKMNLSRQNGLNLAQELADKLTAENYKKSQIIICPNFLYLAEIQAIFSGSKIALGAQNCSAFEKGSYTGQISAKQLADFGVSSVILGHAERRNYCCETNKIIKEKEKIAQKFGLLPIICIGENDEEKSSNKTEKVLKKQIKECCPENGFVLAYEPLWAIGKKSASILEISKICSLIKKIKNVPVLYGGFVKPHNANDFLNLENLDGILVGGASLKSSSFLKIIESAE